MPTKTTHADSSQARTEKLPSGSTVSKMEFKKGAVCRIDTESLSPPGRGRLQWFLTPRIMRALRR